MLSTFFGDLDKVSAVGKTAREKGQCLREN
jgi:hypothetical protein